MTREPFPFPEQFSAPIFRLSPAPFQIVLLLRRQGPNNRTQRRLTWADCGRSGYGNPSRKAAVVEDGDDVIVGGMLDSVND
jgi:hypothetical protein